MAFTISSSVLLRRARDDDQPALERLAQLDSRPLPRGPHLVAELDGRLVAAASVHDGDAVADPFAPSAHAVALLRERVAQLHAAAEPAGPAIQLLRALFPATPRLRA